MGKGIGKSLGVLVFYVSCVLLVGLGWVGAHHVSCNGEVDLSGRDVKVGGETVDGWIVDI